MFRGKPSLNQISTLHTFFEVEQTSSGTNKQTYEDDLCSNAFRKDF